MNVFDLYAKSSLDSGDYEKGLKNAGEQMGGFANKLKGGLSVAAKVGGAAIAAAAAGIAALTKSAISNYAEYEQLVGGVETLFKDSSDTVLKYANEAYKTAGLSANEYMSTVTSFSASLLQSLGGDTSQAAEYANRALSDMSDNANKMGSSMESIQNAYMSFSRGQYQLLDNLKLGYGGTKQEMERLLADAEKLTGIHYDINNLSDVYSAIHIIQTELGITGTTATEASTTIQGSINQMKSAWENFVAGLMDSNADISALTDNLVNSIVIAGKNILPAILTFLP